MSFSASWFSARRGLMVIGSAAALLAGSFHQAGAAPRETPKVLSAQSEAAAVEFARTHHPELAGLLDQLKSSAPAEYRSAVADLEKVRERLERSRDKTPDRYPLELSDWKVSSRIQLLAARMAMGADAALESDLKAALRERVDLRIQLLVEERDRLRRRVDKLNETIAEQQRKSDEQVAKELAGLRRGATATIPPSTGKKDKVARTEAVAGSGATTSPKAADIGGAERKAANSDKPPKKSPSKSNDGRQGIAPK